MKHYALCDQVCQWLAEGRWFSPSTPVSFTNKTDPHDITEILLKVELKTIQPTNQSICWKISSARHVCSCTFFRINEMWLWNLLHLQTSIMFPTHSCFPCWHINWYNPDGSFFSCQYIKLVAFNIGCHLTNTWGPKNGFFSLWL